MNQTATEPTPEAKLFRHSARQIRQVVTANAGGINAGELGVLRRVVGEEGAIP